MFRRNMLVRPLLAALMVVAILAPAAIADPNPPSKAPTFWSYDYQAPIPHPRAEHAVEDHRHGHAVGVDRRHPRVRDPAPRDRHRDSAAGPSRRGGVMFPANAYVIRDIRVDDVPELVRLGWDSEEDWPAGQILIGEINGVVAAALALDENRAVLTSVSGAPYLLAQMRARAAGIQAHRRTPSVADRIRERMGQRLATR